MARIRPASGSRVRRAALPALFAIAVCALCARYDVAAASEADTGPLRDVPIVWFADDARPIPVPEFEEPGLIPYGYESFVSRPFSRFWHPGRNWRRLVTGDAVQEAGDINALDEVVDSAWFTNRIGLRRLSEAELAAGPAFGTELGAGPDRSSPWTIIGAKTAGVTPGFRIRDARGDVWLLKFDPPDHPGMTIRAGVVSNLLFHAMGFHTPVDRLVHFDRAQLVVGEGARMRLARGPKVPMTEANLDSVLAATKSIFGGEYHALASRYLDGVPLGPFDDQDTREGDPNDLIRHENRRELRALQVFAAWVNHFDTKAHNSLDMYVGPEGEGHVRHYLIDFASTLGAYGAEPVPRYGNEFGLDVFPILGRTLGLGLVTDAWADARRPDGLDEIGIFEAETFRPDAWKPDLPNSEMANLTRRDGFWAAKVLSAFTARELRVIVEQGDYQDPRSVDYLVETLIERRDRIVRSWFERVPPLDFFRADPDGVHFRDLAVLRGYEPAEGTRYRYRLATVDAGRRTAGWSRWLATDETFVPLADRPSGSWRDAFAALDQGGQPKPFLAIECQVNRGTGWSASTTVYRARGSGRIVALDR